MKNDIQISIVSPVYQAEAIVDELVEKIELAITPITKHFEIILVDDSSSDQSWQKINAICNQNTKVKGVKLSRNFGQQYAIQAGLDQSEGNYVVTMDCDLQDNPEEIKRLYTVALEGNGVVVASRKNRKDNWIKKAFSKVFYKVLSFLSETNQDDTIANFACYSREAVIALSSNNDHIRYYPMLNQIIGFNYKKIEIEHQNRKNGKSSYTYKKRIDLAFNIILSFSDKPLRLTVKFGILLSFSSICGALILVGNYLYGDLVVKGWTSLALFISFFSGIIISVLGVVGIYVGKTFEATKQRPTYIIEKTVN